MSQSTGSPQKRQVQRTRAWIFEALILLLDEKPYDKISISDITRKAGIARQTFYRNYGDKDDIVIEYLLNTMSFEFLKAEGNKHTNKQEAIVLCFSKKYILAHRAKLEKLLAIDEIQRRIFHDAQKFPLLLLEQFREGLSDDEYLVCRYKLCYQITGCLRVFFDWFIYDMPMSSEHLANMLNAMNTPKVIRYRNIPNVVVRFDGE